MGDRVDGQVEYGGDGDPGTSAQGEERCALAGEAEGVSKFGVEGCEAFENGGVFDHDADCEEGEECIGHGSG